MSTPLQLRPFQIAALEALHCNERKFNHVICVAPTGSGKSLIYEKAAAQPGCKTLLITPLVALARQQWARLKSAQIPVALGAGHESQGPPGGRSGAWIVSPEMLQIPARLAALKRWNPNLLVVDECHCLWEWGLHFRPSFSLIPHLIRDLQITKSLWLTATLPYEARVELKERLVEPVIELGEFNLPSNLFLDFRRVNWETRTQALIQHIKKMQGAGILFVTTRESAEKLGNLMTALGKKTVTYHGGLSSEERKNLESLIAKAIPEVIVATSAFGMGMDYPHLKNALLWQAPPSLLSLVQSIGRVGRHATTRGVATTFWHPDDFRMLEWTIGNSERRRKELMDVLHLLQTPHCRLAQLKFYFDRKTTLEKCGACDVCS
jgi:ATP-dependent DNA helicase RecQ